MTAPDTGSHSFVNTLPFTTELFAGDFKFGADGAVLSYVIWQLLLKSVDDQSDLFPALSTALTLNPYVPSPLVNDPSLYAVKTDTP